MKKEKTAKTEKNEKHWERVTQEFAPVCDADCRVLILGTTPSKKSREVGFITDIRRIASGKCLRQ